MCGSKAEQALRFADVGERVADIAWSEITVNWFYGCLAASRFVHDGKKLVESGSLAQSNIVHLINSLWPAGRGCEQVSLDHIGNVTKVSGCLAVTVDVDRLSF